MNDTILGKLTNVYLGKRDSRIGLFFTLSGDSSCSSSICCWDPEEIKVSEYTKWTEEERNINLANVMREVSKLLQQAKVTDVYKLNGIPVSYTFKNSILQDWRILTEVL